MEIAIKLHTEVIPRFNPLKRGLDKAHKEKNVEEFAKYYHEIYNLMYDVGLTAMKKTVNKKTRYTFKVATPYRNKLKASLQFLSDVFEGGKKELERMRRTPEQNAAADKRSAAMRARWGSW